MANSLKEGSVTESPQPLSIQPPPRGHFTGTENNESPTPSSSTAASSSSSTSPSPSPAPSASTSGVVSDDPTTYWLADSNNEFAVRPSNGTRASGTRARRNNKQNNTNNNNINNNNTSTTTNGTNEVEGDKHEDSVTASGNGYNANNGRNNGRNKHPFSGPASVTSTNGDFNNQRNGKRQIHTNRNTTQKKVSPFYLILILIVIFNYLLICIFNL